MIVGEILSSEGGNGAIALAADNACDTNAVIVAANGDFSPNAGTVCLLRLTHRVIGVGGYSAASRAQQADQGRGPAPDGLYNKPDL